ncbi:glucose-6-phosphate dehydrogenase [Microbacterium esteraromaticum]|uniref:Glucose-6-phosphate 1-dehydrogenase n=1 Tax=Microbacterium esteraromaticum TaxID=57043 RepID=A0A939DY14_9MICO|nr:glucose-6-phosphate dehydrogenase [Microbacterium esteraromaticum]MBN8206327.1 glucose-6-phosphate dehydrogenase [Microbacterium esteraromaticum]MBN8416482.1 glucose-6-phosphate dehydrogenase [Microbacterium esteraromaticum]MCA1306493.1 glucose-6-phosphate dehydrogenase [Microbacterium esteraromaticum]WDH77612.1 glucose-6-phosphate dehydrogenase [Microbacterium esteraromaticum]
MTVPISRGRNPLRDPDDRRLSRIAGPSALVIFGVTGDLSRKKLMPAVYDLANRGLLPPGFALVGFARRDWEDQDFAEVVREAVRQHARTEFREETWQQLLQGIRFVQGTFDDPDAFRRLRETVEKLDVERGTMGNHAFYLSIPPKDFPTVARQLKDSGLVGDDEDDDSCWRRVVIEKPFGDDLESARALNEALEVAFPADSIFRIDHYLGKETVQNILALRFANELFEPLWNRNHIDHVQITMAEDIGVGGRAGYYDGIGAARDVIQNHLLQLLALTAMEEPISMSAEHLRAEKEKVLEAVQLPEDLSLAAARGQYAGGWQGGAKVNGFLEEDGMNPQSHTETYAALKLEIATRRWAGVPFYLRTGKRLGRRVTEIAVVFKRAPQHLLGRTSEHGQNALVIRVQPNEGVTIRFGSKVPGAGTQVRDVTMDFGYGHAFTEASPEAYERLILDVLLGDPPLFPRHEEVELSWKILDPIEEYWASLDTPPEQYAPGSWGPESADALLARDGRVWRRP